jgi:hypothetical protein
MAIDEIRFPFDLLAGRLRGRPREKCFALFRSVVEDMPADGAPVLLIVENKFTDSGRKVHPLPLPFPGPSLRSVVGWDACAGRPDGVRRSAQVMGGDVSHRNRLARRQRGELRWIGHPARRGIRRESRSVCVTYAHLTADPGSADIESVAGPAVTWLMILEQMQHVLGTQEGPVSQQPVVFVRQGAPATDGDQPGITLIREDRHTPNLPAAAHSPKVSQRPHFKADRRPLRRRRVAPRRCGRSWLPSPESLTNTTCSVQRNWVPSWTASNSIVASEAHLNTSSTTDS